MGLGVPPTRKPSGPDLSHHGPGAGGEEGGGSCILRERRKKGHRAALGIPKRRHSPQPQAEGRTAGPSLCPNCHRSSLRPGSSEQKPKVPEKGAMVPEQDLHPLSQHPTSLTAPPHPTCTSTQDTTLLSKECQGPVYKSMRVCAHICACIAHV